MKIYGAGIAGLLAANAFPTAQIFEAGQEGSTTHKALLRFRSSAVGDAVGIDFKKIRVHKGIWHENKFVEPNIQLANLYSQKVIGKTADRSIWNLAPVDRYIAPENFIEQLVDLAKNRINYNSPIKSVTKTDEPVISTIPMSIMCKIAFEGVITEEKTSDLAFEFLPIVVERYRIKDCDVNQTVYFTDPCCTAYRASITGSLMMVESVVDWNGRGFLYDLRPEHLTEIFGIKQDSFELIETTKQSFGKIVPIDDAWRRNFIFQLSQQFNIFSLGRFGCWKNLLVDDLLQDINIIKKLINTSGYERSLAK